MWKGAIHLEGGPLTRKIEGVMPSPSFKFYHKKNHVSRPFDLVGKVSRRRLGQIKIRALLRHTQLNSLWRSNLGIFNWTNRRRDTFPTRSGYFVSLPWFTCLWSVDVSASPQLFLDSLCLCRLAYRANTRHRLLSYSLDTWRVRTSPLTMLILC